MSWQVVVEKTVVQLGYELVDCERTPGGFLRVYIDRVAGDPTGATVLIEDCEKVTRQLQYVLEVEACPYERLEVSSPGLDRPLKKPADYERFSGQEIELVLKMPFQGRKRYKGVLGAQPPGWCVVFHDGKADQTLSFTLAEVKEARLVPVLDFKGKRFLPPAVKPTLGEETDGDRKQ